MAAKPSRADQESPQAGGAFEADKITRSVPQKKEKRKFWAREATAVRALAAGFCSEHQNQSARRRLWETQCILLASLGPGIAIEHADKQAHVEKEG